jgi:hypothetical protein
MSINPYQQPQTPPQWPSVAVTEYRPATTLVQWLSAFLIIDAVFDVVTGLLSVLEVTAFANLEQLAEQGDPGAIAFGLGYLCVGLFTIAAYITTAVLFCVWVNRANKNARAIGAEGMTFTPGWCVGWFFIPIANLFKPYQAVKEVLLASDPGASATDWRYRPVPSFLGGWWAAWLIANFIGQVEFRMSLSGNADLVTTSSWLGIISAVVGVIAALLARAVVKTTHQRQEQKAAQPASSANPAAF